MNAPAAITAKIDALSVKEIFLYSAGTAIVIGGSILLIRRFIQKSGEKRVEKKSSDDASPEAYAKALKMAFENDGWPGTNMTEVRRVYQQIPDKDFLKKVEDKYQQRYHRPLMSDLSDELQSSQYAEIISIIAGKSQKGFSAQNKPAYNYIAWAKRLKAAFDKEYGLLPGTDEAAIKAVFIEIPTQTDFLKVAAAYQNQYHTSMIEDLKSELEYWEYPVYMKLITDKPKSK